MNKETDHSKDKHSSNLTTSNVKDVLSDSGDNLKQMSSQLMEDLSEFLEDRKQDLQGIKGKCKSHIKENPFSTVLGSLAIGTLLGILFKK